MSYRGTGRLLLEGLGAVAAGVIALLVLFWRLHRASAVDFLAPQIERAFAGRIKATVGSTALIWDSNLKSGRGARLALS